MVKMRHGLATLNFNNSIVYGQKHKVWVLIFLVKTNGTGRTKLRRFGEIFCFETKPHCLQGTQLSFSSNGLGNKTIISCLFVV